MNDGEDRIKKRMSQKADNDEPCERYCNKCSLTIPLRSADYKNNSEKYSAQHSKRFPPEALFAKAVDYKGKFRDKVFVLVPTSHTKAEQKRV